jgi:heterodisulfide reductase subunit A
MNRTNHTEKVGVYLCHCGVNISQTVRVRDVVDAMKANPAVVVSTDYKFMCSDPGQKMIEEDIRSKGLTRVVVAACSPHMHELTFRGACERGGLNRYLFQMANIREHCAWVHSDVDKATAKARALVNAAVHRVVHQEPLTPMKAQVHPDTLIIGAGIAGIQAALDIAESGHTVYLVEKQSTIGGQMAKFDKTFPTLDCAACILTPKMVSVSHRKNIKMMTLSEVEAVSGYVGNFKVTIKKKARFVTDACTSCGECAKVCPVHVPNWFDEGAQERTAIHKAFPQAVPNAYSIDRQQSPPCIEACPIRQEAAGYVALIREGRFHEAAQLIRKRNPLAVVCGRVCYHPCESECNRGHVDKPLSIQQLKRFALDWDFKHNGRIDPPVITGHRTEKIAIIGSGPSGLTCAYDLRMKGFGVTVFEQHSIPGGMLAIGIPEYRLPKKLLAAEIAQFKEMGIEFRTNVRLGSDITLDQLFEQGYRAVYLAIGAHESIKLGIPGEHLKGIIGGVDFLRKVNVGITPDLGNNVGVVGGGNTAIDAARTALRQGCKRVTLLYRRTKQEMPASPEEVADAEAEGVHIAYLTAPIEVLGTGERMTGLRCIRMTLGDPDSSGRRRPVPVPGSEHDLEFTNLIVAVSQSPGTAVLDEDSRGRIRLTNWKSIEANPETLQTHDPRIFSGGDVVLGPSTVIASMGQGRRAAESIEKFSNGEPLENFKTHIVRQSVLRGETFRPHSYATTYKDTPKLPREEVQKTDPVARIQSFEEVDIGLTEEQARREASRCLNCGVCVECRECERVCEPKAVDYTMQDETVKVDVGQIIVATGYDLFDASRYVPYGYGKLDNVLGPLEFERMLSSTGPTGGKIRLANGREPRAVAIVHCVGSRDEKFNPHCSRVCCMYALKFAHLVRDRTHAEVYQFYIDMRAFGKGYEEFYKRILDEGVNVVRGKVAEVVERKGDDGDRFLAVRAEDTLVGKFREIPVDMVILCNAVQPARSTEPVAKILGLSKSPSGFLLERHPKLDPFSTVSDGIYIAGCVQGPKDIPDTVAQAGAAAGKVLGMISKGVVDIDPIRATIDEAYCAGCRMCNNLCPYGAIEFIEEKKVSRVNDALCKGCGTCVAACPAGAITGNGFSDSQIYAELEGILEEV